MSVKRFDEIDIMRIFGFIMVVDQHILGGYAQRAEAGFRDSMILHFFYLLGRPAVPMFIAITGFTLFYSNYGKFDLKKYYNKRLGTIVIPYLFWSFATIFLFQKYEMLKSIGEILLTGTASYHLWYMGMTIRIYLWFPVILIIAGWFMKRSKNTRKWALIGFIVLYWIILKNNNYLINWISLGVFNNPSTREKLFIQYSPVFYSIYFVLGAAVWFNYEKFKSYVLKNWRKITAIQVPLTTYMYYIQICRSLPEKYPRFNIEHALYIFYMVNTVIIIYIISVKISERWKEYRSFLLDLGSLSYGAYLVHVIVLDNMAEIVRTWLPMQSFLLSGVIIFILTCVVSLAICHVIRYMPFSKYLIGIKTVQNTATYNMVQEHEYKLKINA